MPGLFAENLALFFLIGALDYCKFLSKTIFKHHRIKNALIYPFGIIIASDIIHTFEHGNKTNTIQTFEHGIKMHYQQTLVITMVDHSLSPYRNFF